MNDTLQYHYLKGDTTSVLRPDRYTFTRARGYVWLQRACFWVLEKLGCHAYDEETTYTQISVQRDSVRDLIREQHNALYCLRGPGAIKGVILGPEEAERLTGEVTRDYYMVSCPSDFVSHYQRGEFQGIKLFVLPWAKGVTLLPDL